MFDIEDVSVNAETNSVNPTLNFRFYFKYEESVSYAYVQSALLYSSQGRLLGHAVPTIDNHENTETIEFLLSDKVDELLRARRQKRMEYAKVVVELTHAAVAQIEKDRHKDHEKAVRFRLDIELVGFEARTVREQGQSMPRLKIRRIKDSKYLTVAHSDWVNKFCPHLGIGKFVLIELQQPTVEKVSEQWSHVYEVIKQRLLTMENNLRKGEWQYVMVDARQVFEDLKVFSGKPADRPFHDDFRNAFRAANHSEDGINEIETMIKAFFDFCSKYIHTKDRAGVPQPCPTATKEDAEFVYAMLVSFVGLLGSKLQHLE